jgi:dTDP-4-dehydrorhamnose reductase
VRVLLTGATGLLGRWIVHCWRPDDGTLIPTNSRGGTLGPHPCLALDLTDAAQVQLALDQSNPDLILHAAAISKPEAARRDPALAWHVNVRGTSLLALWCRHHNRRILLTSTDLVFDGQRGNYSEDASPSPIVEYARTKLAAEALVRDTPGGLVARVCLLYGPSLGGPPTFFDQALADLRQGRPRAFFADEFRTPLDLPTAARALIDLAHSDVAGTLHLAGPERVSRFELFRRLAPVLGYDANLVQPGRLADLPSPEPRPADVSLCSLRLSQILPELHRPPIEEAASRWT